MKRKETIERCDAPGCRYEEISTKDEPATGYHFGKGFYVLAGGGPIPAIYVHDLACLVPAVEYAIEKALK